MPQYEFMSPKDLNAAEWRELQTMARHSFGEGLDRPQEEVDVLTNWDDPERYRESRVHPNSDIGTRLNSDQSFSRPRLAVATEGGDFVGFAYAADNVSGKNRLERAVKMMGAQHRYLWLKEVVVHPDFQRRGVANHLSRMLLFSGDPWQSVATYIWPDEARFMPNVLRRLTFQPTEEQEVKVFGEDTEPARQVRMEAASNYGVLIKMRG